MKAGVDFIGVGCGALIINEYNEFLVLKRSDKCKNEAGKLMIPGGEVDFNEKMEDAIVREIKEELGVEANPERLACVINHILPEENQHWVSSIFYTTIKGFADILEPEKHEEMKWVSLDNPPMEELSIATKLMIEELEKCQN